MDHPAGPTRSEFERRFPPYCKRHNLPIPQMNAHVAGYEVDALFVAERVIVELDSWEFHKDRRSFERDLERDAATRREAITSLFSEEEATSDAGTTADDAKASSRRSRDKGGTPATS